MKRGRHESVGQAIEQIQRLKVKSANEAGKYKEMYITETVKLAQSTIKRLSDRMEDLQANGKNTEDKTLLKLVDEMFDILTESHDNLFKVESNYSFWTDMNKKFND